MADNKENKVLNVPALRFPEFTEEWNYESLDTIAPNITSGRSKPSLGEYNLYGSTGIIGKTATADYSGDMLLVARVGANAGSLQLVNDSCGITDNTLIIKPCKLSSHYLYFYLACDTYQKYNCKDIPSLDNSSIPAEISDIHYDCDLSKVTPLGVPSEIFPNSKLIKSL